MSPKMGPKMNPKMGPKMDPKWDPKWSDVGVKRDHCSMPFLIVFIINLMLFPGGSSPCSFSFLFTSLSFLFISCVSFLLIFVPFPLHSDTYLNHLFALIFSICVPFLLFFFSVFLFCFSFLFCLIRQSTTINEKHFKMKSATEQVSSKG